MIKTVSINLLLIVLFFNSVKAQTMLTHEVGIIVGAESQQTDYGLRYNFKSTLGNYGNSKGIVHYLVFLKSDWEHPYFQDHFKIRTEITFSSNKFEHHGKLVDPSKTSQMAIKLRAMHGGNKMTNIGMQLEYYLKNFYLNKVQQFDDNKFYPYFSAGIHYTFYKAYLNSDLGDWHQDVTVLPAKWQFPGAVSEGGGTTFGLSIGAGLRYRINENWDYVTDLRYQVFFANTVDGLNAPVIENKRKEGMYLLNFGLIYRIPYDFRY